MSNFYGLTIILGTAVLTVATLTSYALPAKAAGVEAVKLRVEHLENPLTLHVAHPRLSWQMNDPRRGARQTGYSVLVASKPELLKEGKADLWETGKVTSDDSVNVTYSGKPLRSRSKAFWTVRLWDAFGKQSSWSKYAVWEMGLLKPEDWKAQWIGIKGNAADEVETLDGVKWIWYPEGNPRQSAPAGERFLRTSMTVPASKTIKSAVLLAIVDNQYTAYVNGKEVSSGEGWQNTPVVDIASALKPGVNAIAFSARNIEPSPAGFAAVVRVKYTDGTSEKISTSNSWKSAMGAGFDFKASPITDIGWKSAMEIGVVGDQPWGKPAAGSGKGGPAEQLRKEFPILKAVKSARVYVTARGSYRLHINGKRVGNDILTPDWTDYRIRINYHGYDVTSLLKQGDNAIAATVGDGWYSSGLGWSLQRNCYGPGPNQLLLQLHIQFSDDTEKTIITDGSWKGAFGPIERSEIYAGETYDARKEHKGWDTAGYIDSLWKTVDFVAANASQKGFENGDGPLLVGQNSPTIKVTDILKPIAITNPSKGVYIYDMGQNFVGWTRLKVKGPEGTNVKLRFAEILKADGNIYRDNLRRAEAADSYTLSGSGVEVFEPHFTYHGSRYVEVTGYPGVPNKDSLTGIVFNTDATPTASLATSDGLLNQLLKNIDWGLRGNIESVPTDCPQRDERLGWMGDAQIIWATACYFRDMSSFTRKWSQDVVDAQS